MVSGADDVRAIGAAAIERLRCTVNLPSRQHEPGRCSRLSRRRTPRRWRSGGVSRRVASGASPRVTLTIKIHPSERDRAGEYATLAGEYPSLCRVAGPDEDAHRVMLEHDLVVGYTSYGLIEAVGLGRGAVSISGEQTPGGVFALCPIPGAADSIPTVSSPEELGALIARSATTAAAPAAHGFFAPQPPGALLQALLDVLRTSGRPMRAA